MTVLLKVFTLLGGLAFFLYGMNVMSGGLGKLAGGSLERSLKTMTKNRLRAWRSARSSPSPSNPRPP